MAPRILPTAPDGSELERWVEDGQQWEPSHSNILYYQSPDERFTLTVQVDEPLRGYLIQLYSADRERDEPVARTVVSDREVALQVTAETAAGADELDALVDEPQKGLDTVYLEDVERGHPQVPDEWEAAEKDDEWRDALDDAFEKADVRRSKGTLTTKTIDGRDYYYLQWREGETVQSQYVAPVEPATD